MRRTLVLLGASIVVAGALPEHAYAQRMEIGPFGSWQFGGGLDTQEGRIGIQADGAWGGVVDIWVRGDGLGELLYSRQATVVTIAEPLQSAGTVVDVTVQYLHLGGLYEPAIGRVRPFAGATAGLTWFDPDEAGFSGASRFSLSLVGGGKAYLARGIGLRAEARLFLTLFADEAEVICRLPGACIIAVEGQLMTQGAVSGSFFVAF
jgi:hypothetical protein